MAAGITLLKDRLGPFRAFLEEVLGPTVEAARRDDALLIDAAVTAGAARAELVATIARAGPFGIGNPEPVLALPSHTIAYADEVGQTHVRARLKARDGSTVSAIAFGAAGRPLGEALLRNRGQCVHAAGTLSLDRWQGDERVQLRLLDLAFVDPAARI
jgi:single-stranded-DNA-specific exonuclease